MALHQENIGFSVENDDVNLPSARSQLCEKDSSGQGLGTMKIDKQMLSRYSSTFTRGMID